MVLTSFGPSWHCTDRIIGTAVLEYGPAETLPPVGAQWKAWRVSADPVVKPAAQTRAESRVLNVRKQKRERDRLSAGGRRIRTLSPTLMTRNSDRLIEFDGAGSPIGRSPFRPILVER